MKNKQTKPVPADVVITITAIRAKGVYRPINGLRPKKNRCAWNFADWICKLNVHLPQQHINRPRLCDLYPCDCGIEPKENER